jgi:1-acyl-sn-glycerol-3-phosphate acyltransferase
MDVCNATLPEVTSPSDAGIWRLNYPTTVIPRMSCMKWFSHKILLLFGWEFTGSVPDSRKMVVVGFPHTSNWDFFVYLAVMEHLHLRSRFLAKRGLFVGPVGWLLRRWGGIPVDRSGGATLIETAVASFMSEEEMVLVIAPEGTRGRTERWKSGFWRIAEAAGVPVVMAFVDGKTKTAGFGPAAMIDGDADQWIADAAEFYAEFNGLKPHNRGPVAL